MMTVLDKHLNIPCGVFDHWQCCGAVFLCLRPLLFCTCTVTRARNNAHHSQLLHLVLLRQWKHAKKRKNVVAKAGKKTGSQQTWSSTWQIFFIFFQDKKILCKSFIRKEMHLVGLFENYRIHRMHMVSNTKEKLCFLYKKTPQGTF